MNTYLSGLTPLRVVRSQNRNDGVDTIKSKWGVLAEGRDAAVQEFPALCDRTVAEDMSS